MSLGILVRTDYSRREELAIWPHAGGSAVSEPVKRDVCENSRGREMRLVASLEELLADPGKERQRRGVEHEADGGRAGSVFGCVGGAELGEPFGAF